VIERVAVVGLLFEAIATMCLLLQTQTGTITSCWSTYGYVQRRHRSVVSLLAGSAIIAVLPLVIELCRVFL